MADPDLVLSQSFPNGVRFVVGAVAAGSAWLLCVELWRGLWPFSFVTPFFAVIVAGGLLVCGAVFAASLFGPAVSVRLSSGLAQIERTTPFKTTRETLLPGSLRAATVEVVSSDSGPDGWRVVLALADGRTLKLPEQETKAEAQAAAARFMAELG